MRRLKPGMMEYEAESIFLDYCYRHGGCRSSLNCKASQQQADSRDAVTH